ncbi:DNA polymerase III subunit alpha [Candidatus Wolfebacteria bacterium]|nr:DNA polymerase III subunit alpha [Candidatus Wolfebacteria bacterium]
MASSPFVHLHTHSHYSLLNALPKIPDLVATAKEHGMSSLALTDNGNLYGAIEFYKTCQKNDIKPIIGVDFYLAFRTRHDKEAGIDNRRHRLVLLAENEIGYRNLIKLVTRSHREGFYYKPRIDHELLREHHEGLVAILPSFNSDISSLVKTRDRAGAEQKLADYREIFGAESIFLELTHHPEVDGHPTLQKDITALGRAMGVPLVAAHNVYYLTPEDKQARDTLLSVQSTVGFREQSGLTNNEEDFSFISPAQAEEYFRTAPDALENTVRIAERCTLKLTLGSWLFPNVAIPNGTTYDSEFRRLVEAGLKRQELPETKEVRDRIEYEIKTICDKGYAPYFLIVGDLMRFAHQNGILTTIRGSVAGSMVTYLMGITNINPLEYELPFERFLNPDRPSPPDIDMDFADNRRDEVIAYTREKYGEDRVAQIGTFGTMMARGSVRDTARAMGYDYSVGDRIARIIPFGSQGFPMTIDQAMEQESELRELYAKDADSRTIIDMAKKIEGCARHIGVHAAGVVISPVPLDDIVPIQPDTKNEGKLITQYDMHSVEDVGLLKFDFLGLTNLAVLADAIKRVKKLLDIDIDIENIPLDDAETFAMLARGETVGVFQLAGQAMTKFLKELKPNSIHDINAMIALYRPGPMQNIPHYIARKHGQESVTYYHPKMREFLDKSYGILVYQDDLLMTALALAGYTWTTVDAFRKAVGKKIPKEMARQHEIFVKGCMEHSGMTDTQAEGLWNLFEPFQGYGFNKAHAASYGRVAYQTAYMKARHPMMYMAALLTADAGDVDKVAEIINECKRMHIEVLPPDINESLGDFTVVLDADEKPTHAIRFGLYSIKNFGQGIAESIIAERKARGAFVSLADFLERVKDRNLNKKSLESLIKCGALDEFGERGMMLGNIDDLLSHSRAAHDKSENQESLFALLPEDASVRDLTLQPSEPASDIDKLAWEKELLGLYISGHPLDRFREKLEGRDWDIARAKDVLEPGNSTMVWGVIEESRRIITRGGEHMAFLRVADYTGSLEVVVFPKLYRICADKINTGTCVAVKGIMSDRNGDISLLADAVKELK